jgi:hypothetical protein
VLLHKSWKGYVIAKNKGEYDKQIQYAKIIQKLQRELNLEVSSFPQLGIIALDGDIEEEKYDDHNNYKRNTGLTNDGYIIVNPYNP